MQTSKAKESHTREEMTTRSKPKVNKRIGGPERGKTARKELEKIYADPKHPMHLAKDIEFVNKFDVTRHTIYKIREELDVPPRSKRVLTVLENMDTAAFTLNELVEKLNLKYQNLYKIMNDNKLPYRRE